MPSPSSFPGPGSAPTGGADPSVETALLAGRPCVVAPLDMGATRFSSGDRHV